MENEYEIHSQKRKEIVADSYPGTGNRVRLESSEWCLDSLRVEKTH